MAIAVVAMDGDAGQTLEAQRARQVRRGTSANMEVVPRLAVRSGQYRTQVEVAARLRRDAVQTVGGRGEGLDVFAEFRCAPVGGIEIGLRGESLHEVGSEQVAEKDRRVAAAGAADEDRLLRRELLDVFAQQCQQGVDILGNRGNAVLIAGPRMVAKQDAVVVQEPGAAHEIERGN
ncbi:MAG: hypothetical protein ACREYD_09605 [Casimicrobiaceae bacterium]